MTTLKHAISSFKNGCIILVYILFTSCLAHYPTTFNKKFKVLSDIQLDVKQQVNAIAKSSPSPLRHVRHWLVPNPLIASPLNAFVNGTRTMNTVSISVPSMSETVKNNDLTHFGLDFQAGFAVLKRALLTSVESRKDRFTSGCDIAEIPKDSCKTISPPVLMTDSPQVYVSERLTRGMK